MTTSFSFGDPNAGTTLQLAGFRLSFACGANGITGTNMNVSDGTVEIASGRYTANRWNNSGAGATLVIREGATYASSVDSDSRCTFLNVENAGVVEMDAAHTLRVTGTYSGSGLVNNLWFGNGATLATLGVSVSNRLVQEGALTVDRSRDRVRRGGAADRTRKRRIASDGRPQREDRLLAGKAVGCPVCPERIPVPLARFAEAGRSLPVEQLLLDHDPLIGGVRTDQGLGLAPSTCASCSRRRLTICSTICGYRSARLTCSVGSVVSS